MRITFLTHFPGRGGSTDLLKQLQAFFASQGHATEIVCGTDDGLPQHERYLVVPTGRGHVERRQNYLQTIADTKPDVVYVISGSEEFDVLRFVDVPRIHHISSLESHDCIDIPRLVRRTAEFTELFTANTPDVLETIQAWTSVAPERLALAPYRLNPLWLEAPPLTVKAPSEPIHVCFCARIETRQKRAHWLPEIISNARLRGLNLRWDILGDGSYMPELRRAVGTHKNVTLHGWVSPAAMKEIYQNSDIFFLCSLWEGLPIAMAEAMTCGVASVVPAIPAGMIYAVQHRDGGWVYDAKSPSAAVDALALACSDCELLHKKKTNAANSASVLFRPDTIRDSLNELEQRMRGLTNNRRRLDPGTASRLRSVRLSRAVKRKTLAAIRKLINRT